MSDNPIKKNTILKFVAGLVEVVVSPVLIVIMLWGIVSALVMMLTVLVVCCIRGRYIVFVHSDSPVWKSYITDNQIDDIFYCLPLDDERYNLEEVVEFANEVGVSVHIMQEQIIKDISAKSDFAGDLSKQFGEGRMG